MKRKEKSPAEERSSGKREKFSPEESPDISEVPPPARSDSVKSQGFDAKEGEISME